MPLRSPPSPLFNLEIWTRRAYLVMETARSAKNTSASLVATSLHLTLITARPEVWRGGGREGMWSASVRLKRPKKRRPRERERKREMERWEKWRESAQSQDWLWSDALVLCDISDGLLVFLNDGTYCNPRDIIEILHHFISEEFAVCLTGVLWLALHSSFFFSVCIVSTPSSHIHETATVEFHSFDYIKRKTLHRSIKNFWKKENYL